MSYNIMLFEPEIVDKAWFAGQAYRQRVTKTVKDWCIQENADLCFNLGIFGLSTGLGCSYVRAKGKDIAYGSEKPHILTLNEANQCRGYSDGIVEQKISINVPMGGTRTRNGVGMTYDGTIIVAQTDHGVTEAVFCNTVNNFVKDRGKAVRLFTLQDGGMSTQEYSALSSLNFAPERGRPVANVLCIKLKRGIIITQPVYKDVKGRNAELVQIAVGGISCDRRCGPATAARIKAAQKAWGWDTPLQCGVASYLTLKKLGFVIGF